MRASKGTKTEYTSKRIIKIGASFADAPIFIGDRKIRCRISEQNRVRLALRGIPEGVQRYVEGDVRLEFIG